MWKIQDMWLFGFCSHTKIVTDFTAEVFLVEKYERCGGSATCSKCGKSFHVYVAGNINEKYDALDYLKELPQ